MQAPKQRPWRTGPLEIDVANHRLLREGRAVPLTPKAYAVLACLLAHPGELVRKDALFATVWAERVVTDAALSRVIRELRRSLGDDAQEPRFIATVHGVGFRWVAALDAAPQPAPSATAPAAPTSPPASLLATPVLGRDAELAQLQAAWDRARRGAREIVFVSGESGIGKTALIEAFANGPDIAAHVVQGRCIDSYGEREPYLPWLDVLEHLARQRGDAALTATLTQVAPAWLALMPRPVAAAPTSMGAPDDWTPPRLRRELAQALEALAERSPLLIWLEDLHWCDPSSLDLLGLIAARPQAAALMVVASLRPGDAAGSPVAALRDALQQRHQAWELPLAPLPMPAVQGLLRQRLGSARDEREAQSLAAWVHRRSEGHALYALALLDDVLTRQLTRPTPQGWVLSRPWQDDDAAMPDSLRRLLRWRIESLPDAEREVFLAAGVIGERWAAASVAAALQRDVAEVERLCTALARRALLQALPEPTHWPDGTICASFAFEHALHQQAAWDEVTPALRRRWQRRMAHRLEAAYRADAGAAAAAAQELALRFEQADECPHALVHLRRAAAQALARCAYREGIALLRHGLELLPRCAGWSEAQIEREELSLRLPLGAALMAREGYAAAEVRQCYARTLALCPRVGGEADWSRALRGQWNVDFLSCELRAAAASAQALLERAQAQGDEALALDAHAKLGQTLLHQGRLDAAAGHLQRVLDSPLCREDPALRRAWPRVAAYQTWVHWYSGRAGEAARLGEQAVAAAAEAGPHSQAFALGYVGWIQLMSGDADGALQRATQQGALSLEVGLAYWEQLARFLRGAVAVRQGRLPEGIATMQRAKDDMLAAGGQVGVPYLLCELAQALIDAGRVDEARGALDDAERRMRDQGNGLYLAQAERLRERLLTPQ